MMSSISINYKGALLAAVVSLVIGAIYYHDSVLGKQWKKLAKVDVKQYDKDVPKVAPLMFLAAFLVGLALEYFACLYHSYFGGSWLVAGLETALIAWGGFSLSTIVLHGAVEQKPRNLLYINIGNRLLTYVAIGLVVGWLHP